MIENPEKLTEIKLRYSRTRGESPDQWARRLASVYYRGWSFLKGGDPKWFNERVAEIRATMPCDS